MSKRESIARYHLIIKRLKRCPASFKEIDAYLKRESEMQEYNYQISKRTFKRDLNDILSLFNINITYNFKEQHYEITDDFQPELNQRILESFDVFNALNLSDKLSKYIHFEKRTPIGSKYLSEILHAIKNRLLISFHYHKYIENKSNRKVEPYALKEFRSRWYLLAYDLKNKGIRTFALDRISFMQISTIKHNKTMNFKVKDHFKDSFGIIGPNKKEPSKIILSFNKTQGKYIKSLPLHSSQKILSDNEKELQISLFIYITYDFLIELLSFGSSLKVIEPITLKNLLITKYKEALKQY